MGGWQGSPLLVLRDAYVEWQRSIHSRIAPRPTPDGNLGEAFTIAGLTAVRTKTARTRTMPDAEACLAKLDDVTLWEGSNAFKPEAAEEEQVEPEPDEQDEIPF